MKQIEVKCGPDPESLLVIVDGTDVSEKTTLVRLFLDRREKAPIVEAMVAGVVEQYHLVSLDVTGPKPEAPAVTESKPHDLSAPTEAVSEPRAEGHVEPEAEGIK